MKEMPENYACAAAYIEQIPRFTKKHTLEHTKEFLRRLGNPGEDARILHVAGTNGKGSVCAYLQAILEAEGKKTGFFTSPHLVSVNERIQINRKPVSDAVFYEIFCEVFETVSKMEQEGIEHPSYFEFLYGMGMTAFAREQVEYIILETGLGGRLDATNSIEHPFLTILTSISLDHTEILGNTIQEIAVEKAGIIKEGVPIFYDGSSKEASRIIRKRAQEKGADCREISKNAFEILEVGRNHIAFSRRNAYDKDIIWSVPLCGMYQVTNAELALQAMDYAFAGENVCRRSWKEAIANVQWEGRMEEIAPHLTVDGAHNPGAIAAFVESLLLLQKEEKELPVLIFSAVADKKYEQMITFLCEHLEVKCYIVTEISDKRRVPAEELEQLFRKHTDRQVFLKKNLEDALHTAYAKRGEGEIYCLGSLYLVGMVKKLLSGGGKDA